ncbi:hypothetical protein BH10ACI1_BH10ACI1_34870 [soil metagenome]
MPFPRTQPEINNLLQVWRLRLELYQVQFGLSDAQINQQKDDAVIYDHLLTARMVFNTEILKFNNYFKNASVGNMYETANEYPLINLIPMPPLINSVVKNGIIPRNEELYNFLKRHPNKTTVVLADLGISGKSGSAIPSELLKPGIGGNPLPDDTISLKFNKQGQKAIRFQMRRNGEAWQNIGDPTTSPFIDETPSLDGKPEKREYRAIYLVKNQPVGNYSNIITVYTTP